MKTKPKTEYIEENEYVSVNLLSNPIKTLSTLFTIIYEQFVRFVNFLIGHKLLILIIFGYLGLSFFEGGHTEVILN